MKTSSRFFSCWVLSGLFCLSFLAGCGGSDAGFQAQVNGKVTLEDQPFSGASIWLTAVRSGASYHSDLKDDGTYSVTLKEVEPGDVFQVSFAGLQAEEHQPKDQVDGAGVPLRAPMPKIPSRYFEGTTSGHEITISDHKPVTFDLNLKSK